MSFLVSSNSPKERTKNFDYTTMDYGTSSGIVFALCLGELKTQKDISKLTDL